MKRHALPALAVSCALLFAACSSNKTKTTATATTAAASATTTAGATGSGTDITPYSAFSGPAPTGLPAKVTVGVPVDSTGVGVAAVGTDELDGIKLAQKEINDTHFLGSKTTIALDSIDTQGDKQQAVQAALKLVSDKVSAVVGFTLTPSWLAAAPALTAAQIPAMSVELSGAGVAEAGNYSFRTYPNVSLVFPASDTVFAQHYSWKTAAYIVQSDAASAAQVAAVRQKNFESMGIKTVSAQTFTSKDTDIRAQLTAIKNAHPDVLVVTPNPDLDTLVYLQAAEVGVKAALLGSPDVSAAILKAAGPQMQCMQYTTVWNPLSTVSANPHFLKYWAANGTGKPPTVFNAAGYSAMWAMAGGIRTANSDKGSDIRDALVKMPTVPTAMGDMNFSNNRSAALAGTRVQVQNSKLVVWDPNKPCTGSA